MASAKIYVQNQEFFLPLIHRIYSKSGYIYYINSTQFKNTSTVMLYTTMSTSLNPLTIAYRFLQPMLYHISYRVVYYTKKPDNLQECRRTHQLLRARTMSHTYTHIRPKISLDSPIQEDGPEFLCLLGSKPKLGMMSLVGSQSRLGLSFFWKLRMSFCRATLLCRTSASGNQFCSCFIGNCQFVMGSYNDKSK